jgi:hypothetical protein
MPSQECASDPALVFLHIPKTGGTTLHYHFSANFAPEETCPERFSNLDAYSVDDLRQWRFFSGHFNSDEIKRIPRPTFRVTVLRNPIERLLSNYYYWRRLSHEYIEQYGLNGPRITKAGTLIDFLRSDEPEILQNTVNPITIQLAGAVLAKPDGYALMRDGEQIGWLSEAQLVSRALEALLSCDVLGDISQLKDIYGRVAQVFGMAPLNELAHLNTKEEVDEAREPYKAEAITPEIWSLLEKKTRLDRVLYHLARDHWQRGLGRLDMCMGDRRGFIPLSQ